MNNKTLWLGLGIVVAVFVIGAYMLSSGKEVAAPTSQPESTTEATDETSIVSGETQEITVEASEFKFTPSKLSLKANTKVALTVKNRGSMSHDFIINGLGVATKTILPGEEEVIEFTPTKGEFTYYCSIANHRVLGMEGTIEIK